MRILVLSDIHANLAALDAVLEGAGACDQLWCLGDLVGYGPDPEACVDRLRSLDPLCLAGNHDLAAVGRLPLGDFNPDAREAALWTRSRLGEASRSWLLGLPTMRAITGLDITLVHGSPVDPIWAHVFSPSAARSAFDAIGTGLCFNGHTHVPLLYREAKPGGRIVEERFPAGSPTGFTRGRLLVNPGSVGQPRDGDPRASFCILDTGTMAVTNHRVDYDISRTQDGMKAAGLPSGLIERLRYGR